jgi:CheY-like chemotaxis protein
MEGEMMGILVIEDNIITQRLYIELLTNWGYYACTADSTPQAVGMLKSGWVPDAIISDYNLGPSDTGITAIATIEGLLGRKVPAVIITGEWHLPDIDIPVFSKPLAPSHLKQILVALLRTSTRATT